MIGAGQTCLPGADHDDVDILPRPRRPDVVHVSTNSTGARDLPVCGPCGWSAKLPPRPREHLRVRRAWPTRRRADVTGGSMARPVPPRSADRTVVRPVGVRTPLYRGVRPVQPGARGPLGLHTTDVQCLNLLSLESGPVTIGRVGELTGLSTGAATRLVDRLERAGYVTRKRDRTDRRRVLVTTVPERMAAFGQIWDDLSGDWWRWSTASTRNGSACSSPTCVTPSNCARPRRGACARARPVRRA